MTNRLRQLLPIACVGALGLLFVYGGVYGALRAPPGDFANYYTAARLALQHQFTDPRLYEFYRFDQLVQRDFPGTLGAFMPHPPEMVLPLMPLVWLGPYPAKIAFIALNLGLLALAALLLQRISRLEWPILAGLVLLNGTSLWNQFRQGQLYILLLVLIVLGLWLHLRGADFWAGVCFGLLVPIKYVPIVFVLYFLARRNWRLVGGAALAIGLIGLIGLYFTSLDLHLFFLTQILPPHLAGRITNPFTAVFQSYPALLNRLFVYEPSLNATPALDFPPARDALKNLIAWLLIVLAIFGIRAFPAESERQRTIFAVALLALLVLVNSPAAASYHLVLMILPMVLLAGLSVERTGRLPTLLIVLYALIHFVPFSALYRFDGAGWASILAYPRLALLTAFFVLALPRATIRSWAFAGTGPAIVAISILLAVLTPAAPTDPARWAGYDGLIIRNLAVRGDQLFYEHEVASGYATFVNGTPTQERPPPPRTTTRDGAFRLYVAPVRSGLGSDEQIFIQNTRTQATQQVTFAAGKSIEPVWADDDRRIYFLSDRRRGIDCTTIYYLDAITLQNKVTR